MRVPIEWLKELVSFRAGPDQLAQLLTMAGLETVLLPDDILDVDVLPNRADCWSILGVAREVSAITKFKLKNIHYKTKESAKKINGSVKVEVRDKELCPRYMVRVIENVKVGESPEWLKKKLERSGLRSINNVVDVTNYLLHEMGQPLHAFDAALVKDQFIIVRRANPEEKITTLDGKEQLLTPDVLVIADPEKVIAIGGVMGGANSEVNSETRTIILESAFFNPISIHKTSKLLKLRTEASIRFDYGVDWDGVETGLDRAAALIAELGRGDVLKGKLDAIGKSRKPRCLELRPGRANQLLGTEIATGDMISILKRLGFTVKRGDSGKLKVEVPPYRLMDIEREIDLIEEIARIWGYNRIEATMPFAGFAGRNRNLEDIFRSKLVDILTGEGLTEVETYSMLGPKDFEQTGISQEVTVKIANPLTVEESLMRPELLPGLLKVAAYNKNRQRDNIFVFEIGRTFAPAHDKLPKERWHVAGLLTGSPFMSALDKGEADYFYLKGVVENMFQGIGCEPPKISEADNFLLQPGRGAVIEGIGIFGALHPDIQRNYEFTRPVFFFEFDAEALFELAAANKKSYRPLPRFPSVTRDVSMFLPPDLENQVIISTIYKTGGSLVESAFPFDKYKDSAAYRIVYRHPDRTLTEEEINIKQQEIVNALVNKLSVRLRS